MHARVEYCNVQLSVAFKFFHVTEAAAVVAFSKASFVRPFAFLTNICVAFLRTADVFSVSAEIRTTSFFVLIHFYRIKNQNADCLLKMIARIKSLIFYSLTEAPLDWVQWGMHPSLEGL